MIYAGELPLVDPGEDNPAFESFMKLCDRVRTMKVRANADTPADARNALKFGCEGIGLFRIEHMF